METLDPKQTVWAPHPVDGYQLCRIVDLSTNTLTLDPIETSGKPITAIYDEVFFAEEDNKKDADDNCSLMYLNEATLLNNLRIRYKKNQIYTYVANILLAVNPYHDMKGLYSTATIRKYTGKSLGVLPPHVFAIADKAFREMKTLKTSQSIIISGESGAGKTESTKYTLRFLTESYGASAGIIEQRIVEANPLLESFGNAKTMRNNNSSRFGKFVEIHYSDKFEVVGGWVSHYLLEKSRICGQMSEERNYHIFYRVLAGAPADVLSQLSLDPNASYAYLNPRSRKDQSLNDASDYKTLVSSMDKIGLTDEERGNLLRLTAAILHLGNTTFDELTKDAKEMSMVSKTSARSFALACKLLHLEELELQRALVSRVMATAKGGMVGTIINIPLKKEQAVSARDALAKALYIRMFNWIVTRVNKCFPFQSSSHYIGVLDIAGFEYFKDNSFEQFCINYCNEKLQQYFNSRILKEEQDLYKREGLNVLEVHYVDNQDCIDLFEAKTLGILDLLDEECKLPKGSNQHFTTAVHKKHADHFRLMLPRKSQLNYNKSVRDDEGFIIRHFAGAVCYLTEGFLDKNNDALHESLEVAIGESTDPFIKSLFNGKISRSPSGTKKLALISVGSKFRTQLNELMAKLQSTGAHFIRCLKPNMTMESSHFVGGQIVSQLQCAGMVSVLKLMQGGFPSRTMFKDLYQTYKGYLPAKLAKLDPRTFSRALFMAVGMREDDFSFGMSKVFFRAGKFAEFDQIMKTDPENLAALVNRVEHWLVHQRWKKVIYGAISVQKLARKIQYRHSNAIMIQKTVRMFLAVQKHRPRYRGILELKKLRQRCDFMSSLVAVLKNDKEALTEKIHELESNIDREISKLKAQVVKSEDIEAEYHSLFQRCEAFVRELREREQKQIEEEKEAERLRKLKEEQERLRKIQEEMERERRRQEEEERRRQQEEEERRLKAEMEARRKKEEEEARRRQEEEERKRKAEEEQEKERLRLLQIQEEEEKRKAQEEQERRDYELALRLAQDESQPQSVVVEANRPMESRIARQSLRRSEKYISKQQEILRKKYDLSKWKYADLRDTINTSCDIDLLEACRDEFHRRLKVYHAWKMQNRAKKKENVPQRMPDSVQQEVNANPPTPPVRKSSLSSLAQAVPQNQQRFFRVPFVKPDPPGQRTLNKKKGWWLAHFDGQWVVRQLELHPDRSPILLIAGIDDMQMCELSLDETGLTKKRGAEILEREFEQLWQRYGGQPYKQQPPKSTQP